jgi:hypothetical protein
LAGVIAAHAAVRSGKNACLEEGSVNEVVYEPLIQLCDRLAEATHAGRVDWTAREDTAFVYQGASAAVEIRSRDRDGEAPFELAIFNPDGGKVDVLVSAWSADEEPAVWNEPLFDLYVAARRRALGVDDIIRDLLVELQTTVAASTK